jgi:hypothetical protein
MPAYVEGRFEIRALHLWYKYVLTARTSGWLGYRGSHIEIEPDDVPDIRVDTGPIALVRGECSISGIVVDVNDKPVADLRLYCLGEDQSGSRAVTEAGGTFTLDGTVGIRSVAIRTTPYIGKVYNLRISNSDRYLVGKDGVIVRDY